MRFYSARVSKIGHKCNLPSQLHITSTIPLGKPFRNSCIQSTIVYTKGIDMWSLGCILAEMAAGKPIFPGTSTVNQVEKIMATIPTPSKEDIEAVCISGVGSCMIKNASSVTKIPIQSLMDNNAPEDALKLLNRLLLFNPLKRLTAEQALEEDYVAKFHDLDQEIVLNTSVTVPLNDDVRLSVDDYRNKLYELLSTHHSRTKLENIRSKEVTSAIQSRVARNTEKYFRPHRPVKEKPLSHSESKIGCQMKSNSHSVATNARSDSKVVTKHNLTFPEPKICRGGGDYDNKIYMKSTSELQNKDRSAKKRFSNSKSIIHNSFNSYHKTHGVITESALMELRAAGMR